MSSCIEIRICTVEFSYLLKVYLSKDEKFKYFTQYDTNKGKSITYNHEIYVVFFLYITKN